MADLQRERPTERSFRLQRLRMVPLLAVLFGTLVFAAAVWHHGAPGSWLLVPVFLLMRFLLFPHRPWRRRGFVLSDDDTARL